MADGPAGFTPDSSCPALLRVPLGFRRLRARGCHPLRPDFPVRRARLRLPTSRPYYPAGAGTPAVWAVPRSLATTWGITFVFFSSGYLDVSVPRVGPATWWRRQAFSLPGCPVRTRADQGMFAPPRAFSQLTASFLASESLGIHRPPLSAFLFSLTERSTFQ